MRTEQGRIPIALLSFFCLILAGVLPACSNPADDKAAALHVIDGDSIVLSDGRHVRYIGIDSPEATGSLARFGAMATELNKRLLSNKSLLVETEKQSRDAHGRVLANIFLPDGTLVQEALLNQGVAWVLYVPPNTKHSERLRHAQARAIAGNVGLWRFFAGKKGPYIANKRTMRFHIASCESAKKIAKKNQLHGNDALCFFEKGYAPCRQCFEAWLSASGMPNQVSPLPHGRSAVLTPSGLFSASLRDPR